MAELEKLVADLKAQRDLLMKHIEQMKKEKESIQEKFAKLQEEVVKMIIRMKEDFARYDAIVKDL